MAKGDDIRSVAAPYMHARKYILSVYRDIHVLSCLFWLRGWCHHQAAVFWCVVVIWWNIESVSMMKWAAHDIIYLSLYSFFMEMNYQFEQMQTWLFLLLHNRQMKIINLNVGSFRNTFNYLFEKSKTVKIRTLTNIYDQKYQKG